MSQVNTTIHVPLHARVAQLQAVMLIAVGHSFAPQRIPQGLFSCTGIGFERGTLEFEDAAGGFHDWSFWAEDEADQFKTLCAPASPLAIAVGRRLVAVFGGEMKYVTPGVSRQTSPPSDVIVDDRQAWLLPPRRGDDGDRRWDQFQRALAAVTPIVPQELIDALPLAQASALTAQEQRLFDWLAGQQRQHGLNEALPVASPSRPNGPRL